MNYLIKGEFNKVLNVFENKKIILYSRTSLIGFDKKIIEIFDKNKNIITSLTDKKSFLKKLINIVDLGSKEIEFQGRKGVSYKGYLKILDEIIIFKYNPILFFNPYISIYFDTTKIGFVKKKFFKFGSEFHIKLDDSLNYSYQLYILIYMLMFESVFDHE